LIAGTFRIGSFRPFFDTEDEMTITVLSGLLRGRLQTTQAPVAPARVPPRLNHSGRSRQQ
jgi:hypothetical protein